MKKNNSELIAPCVKNNFFFSILRDEEIDFLISNSTLITKPVSEPIVKQGEETGFFYFIQEGVAEVWIATDTQRELRATLREGDIIGLIQSDDEQHRIASATVLPATAMTLIKIEVRIIHELAQRNPEFKKRITQHSEQIVAVNLLKRAFPFKQVSTENMLACVKKIKKQIYKEGEVIFHQGERGDYIYFIESGAVDIFITTSGIERKLVALSGEEIFGEVAVLTTEPRNASARAICPTKLLTIHRDDLLECLKEKNAVLSFQNYIYHRSRPKRIETIEVMHRINAESEKISILKNKATTTYFQLSEHGWFIWELLDGNNTINDINLKLMKKFQIYSPQLVEEIIENLVDSGFVTVSRWQIEKNYNLPLWIKILLNLRKCMELEWTFHEVDNFFSKFYAKVGTFIFQKSTYFLMATIILLGIVAFVFVTPKSISIIKNTPHNYWFLIALFPLQLLSAFLHEFSHGLTTKASSRAVNGAGVGLYWFMPIFFVDTSDTWLATPKQRIAVNSAGMISDVVLAGIASVVAWFLYPSIIAAFLWLFACLNYFSLIRNLDPLFEMDGYYIMTNIFDRANLRQDALMFLFDRKTPKKNTKPEISYWIVCVIMFVLTIALTILFQHYILAVLFPKFFSGKYSIMSFIFPLLVAVLFFLSVWVQGKRIRMHNS